MFISKLQIKNFKRFTDLTIDLAPNRNGLQPQPDGVPLTGVLNTSSLSLSRERCPQDGEGCITTQEAGEVPKLVLLIGANGSGKSCVFDAFEFFASAQLWDEVPHFNENTNEEWKEQHLEIPSSIQSYLNKQPSGTRLLPPKLFDIRILEGSNGEFYLGNSCFRSDDQNPYKFYGRSAFRYTPRITKTSIGTSKTSIDQDADRPKTYIDIDNLRMEADIDQIFSNFLKEIKTKNNAQERFNTTLNDAFRNIFGDNTTSLKYEDFDLPLNGNPVRFWFRKGSSKIHYDYLSAGEKMVFDLLLNLYARRDSFKDAIYFFDEIDLHLNTSLQFDLLKEIVENWIPENSQVWVASHSLGFIDYARQADNAAIIDFDNLDFDEVQVLKPKEADEFDVYDVVFGVHNIELKQSFIEYLKNTNRKTFVCEGNDQSYLSKLNLLNITFTDKFGKNKTNKKAVIQISKNEGVFGLIDRDYLTEAEVTKLKQENQRLYILDFYCIENYFYHPENIQEIFPDLNIEEYIKKLTELKNQESDELITKLSQDRNEYKQLEKQEVLIKKSLESDKFEIFYPFLNINKVNKSQLIQEFRLCKEAQLAQTEWFRSQIEALLK